ncbi:MAG: hypothetical protein R3222_01020, partial [Balneolaceae bacterium]|nr:hypothetical protein [Balneolaceae bacterium]
MRSSRISKTAAFVAIKIYGLTLMEPYRKLYDDEIIEFYSRLVNQLPLPLRRYHSLLTKKWFRSASIFLEESLLPGDLMHILMRKHYLSSVIDCCIHKNYSQIVVLGAGFDHIGAIYSKNGVRCI